MLKIKSQICCFTKPLIMALAVFLTGQVKSDGAVFNASNIPSDWASYIGSGQNLTITDGDFNSNTWLEPGVGQASFSQVSSGGNPGSYFQHGRTNVGFNVGLDILFTSTFTISGLRWEPTNMGAIFKLSFSLDYKLVFGAPLEVYPALFQSGQVYRPTSVSYTSRGEWMHVEANDVSNFEHYIWVDGIPSYIVPYNPYGDPIEFGFVFGRRYGSSPPETSVMAVDNYSVTIPEPGMGMVTAYSLILMFSRKKSTS